MYPAIEIEHMILPTSSLALLLGAVGIILLAALRAPGQNLRRRFAVGAASAALAAALIGFILTDLLLHRELPWHATVAGALVSAALAAIVLKFCACMRRIHFLLLADFLAPSLALGIFIVRVGCFFAGCDYGTPTALPWGVRFYSGLALAWYRTPLGVPVHPTQLYEAGLALAILALLLRQSPARTAEGTNSLTLIAAYSVGRFLIEFLRGDADRGFLGPVSVPQVLCLAAMTIVGIVYFAQDRHKPQTQAA